MIKEKLLKYFQKKSALKLLSQVFQQKNTIIEKINGIYVQKHDERILQIVLMSQKSKIQKLQTYTKNFQRAVFVDIGANYGEFSNEMSSCCEHVIAIEPNPIVFSCLHKSFRGSRNVELVNCAIVPSDCGDSYVDLQINPFSSGGSHLIDSRCEVKKTILISSKTIKVSDLLTRIKLQDNDVVIFKIDIEGYEYPIVKSIIKDFNKFKYIIMFEFIEKNSLVSIDEILRELQNLPIIKAYTFCSITDNISILDKDSSKVFSNGEILLANFECSLL